MKELDIKWLQEYAEQEKRYKWGKQIKLLLTAYEDSQLEIEELKTTIDLFKNANDNVADITQTIINKNYVSKDKIKAKIEELKKLNDESTGIGYWFAIYYLQSLLEKD